MRANILVDALGNTHRTTHYIANHAVRAFVTLDSVHSTCYCCTAGGCCLPTVHSSDQLGYAWRMACDTRAGNQLWLTF